MMAADLTREPGDTARVLRGRLVLDDRVVQGRLLVDGGLIQAVEVDEGASPIGNGKPLGPGPPDGVLADETYLLPGFVDLHVHGWGGYDAMGTETDLAGMAGALIAHGTTSFVPTAVSAPLDVAAAFVARVRAWAAHAPGNVAEPLGANLEGPFLAPARKGAHRVSVLLRPADAPRDAVDALLDGLRVMTIAPELEGAAELISRLSARGVVVSLGHSDATASCAAAGYDAGARSTTHLFNAMRGLDHRDPGLAAVAMAREDVAVELIADGFHVHRALWPLVWRLKPAHRLILVSDALPIAGSPAGTPEGHASLGGLAVEIRDGRALIAGTDRLAGSLIALDDAVRNMVSAGLPLPRAAAAASANPLALLGIADRGRLAPGLRADIVELDGALRVQRVMRGGQWAWARPVAVRPHSSTV